MLIISCKTLKHRELWFLGSYSIHKYDTVYTASHDNYKNKMPNLLLYNIYSKLGFACPNQQPAYVRQEVD